MTVKTYQTVIEVIKPYIPPGPPPPPPTPEVNVAQFLVEAAIPISNFNSVSGIFNTTDTIMGFVRSLERRGNLCAPGQHAVLTLTPEYPYNVNPGAPVKLYEYGVLVLTGYVIGASYERPSHDIVVDIDDTYTRMLNYFLDEQEVTTAGHDTTFWVDYLCYLTGNTYKIKAPARPVPAGVQLGLRTAHEALQDILAYASWYVWPDPDGTLVFSYVTTKKERDVNDIINIHYNESTDQTRNVIKLYGTSGIPALGGGQITSIASRGVPGLLVDMVAAIGAPMVGTQTEADLESSYMLGELGSLTRVLEVDIPGDPTMRIGSNISVSYNSGSVQYGGRGAVMALESRVDTEGYTMNVTIGERCPRIAGFTTNSYILVAGTRGGGILRSTDQGHNWSYWNEGLPDGNKFARRVAVNTLNEAMAIVNDKLYYSAGGNWSEATLPNPMNTANDPFVPVASELTSLVAVDATGGKAGFAVLANGRGRLTQTVLGPSNIVYTYASRAWVYTQSIDSTSGSTRWDSVGVGGVDLTSGSTSYTVIGYDLSSRLGSIYVLASTASGSYEPPPPFKPPDCLDGYILYSFGSVNVIGWTYWSPDGGITKFPPYPSASLTRLFLDTTDPYVGNNPFVDGNSAFVVLRATYDSFNAWPYRPTIYLDCRYRMIGNENWTYSTTSWFVSIDSSHAQWDTLTTTNGTVQGGLSLFGIRGGGVGFEAEGRIRMNFSYWDTNLLAYNTSTAWTDWGVVKMSGRFCRS